MVTWLTTAVTWPLKSMRNVKTDKTVPFVPDFNQDTSLEFYWTPCIFISLETFLFDVVSAFSTKQTFKVPLTFVPIEWKKTTFLFLSLEVFSNWRLTSTTRELILYCSFSFRQHTVAKIHNVSKKSHNYWKMKISIFTKFTCWKSHFWQNSHVEYVSQFSQNSHL